MLPGMRKNGIQKISMSGKMATPHGINGNATLATAEKGKVILEARWTGVVEFLESFEKLKVE